MLFNSLTFVVFFAVVLTLHYAPFSWRVKKSNLLIGSYIFYAAWNPPFVILLWISTVVDWVVANKIHIETRQARRRMLSNRRAARGRIAPHHEYSQSGEL